MDKDEDDCGCGDGTDAPRSPDRADLARADGTFSTDGGAGRCVDFTKPDRTLEEYSFTYCVRTTEPEIRGLTLEEPRKVPGRIVDKFLPGLLQEAAVVRAVRDPNTIRSSLAGRGGEVLRDDDDDTDTRDTATRDTLGNAVATLPENFNIDAKVLQSLTRDPGAVTTDRIASAARLSLHADLHRFLGGAVAREPGRRRLNGENPIFWDDDLTDLPGLHDRARPRAAVQAGVGGRRLLDGQPALQPAAGSRPEEADRRRRLGAPRGDQPRGVAYVDATGSTPASTATATSARSSPARSARSTRGGSSASTGGFGGGLGVAGDLRLGRRPARHRRRLRERRQRAPGRTHRARRRRTRSTSCATAPMQSASSVRSQRTSVVHTVAQGERVTATTESVANYNHCHAITIQYFEVLRHLLVRQRLVDVQECLFVPMLMSWFTRDKALRWRNTLATVDAARAARRVRRARADRRGLRRQRPAARAVRRREPRDRRGRPPASASS